MKACLGLALLGLAAPLAAETPSASYVNLGPEISHFIRDDDPFPTKTPTQ